MSFNSNIDNININIIINNSITNKNCNIVAESGTNAVTANIVHGIVPIATIFFFYNHFHNFVLVLISLASFPVIMIVIFIITTIYVGYS